jgi:hypothetical protein
MTKDFLIAFSISTRYFVGGFRQPITSPVWSSIATAAHISKASWTTNQLPDVAVGMRVTVNLLPFNLLPFYIRRFLKLLLPALF